MFLCTWATFIYDCLSSIIWMFNHNDQRYLVYNNNPRYNNQHHNKSQINYQQWKKCTINVTLSHPRMQICLDTQHLIARSIMVDFIHKHIDRVWLEDCDLYTNKLVVYLNKLHLTTHVSSINNEVIHIHNWFLTHSICIKKWSIILHQSTISLAKSTQMH